MTKHIDVQAKLETAVLTNHTGCVSALAFSPDGRTLASASVDATIKLWNTANWRELETLKGSHDELWALVFAPDGRTLFSGSKDGVIKKWSAFPKTRGAKILKRPPDAVEWGLREGVICAVQTNGVMNCWEAASLHPTARYTLPEEYRTNSVASYITPGGWLAWATRQSEIVVWDMATERQLARFRWVAGDNKLLAISPNRRLLAATASEAQQLAILDLVRMEPLATLPKSSSQAVSLRFSNDARWLVAGNFNGTVELWDLERKEAVANWEAHQEFVSAVAFVPGRKRLVTTSWDATASLWELDTHQAAGSFPRTLNAFFALAVAPDGSRVAGGCFDGSINLWDAHTRKQVAVLKAGGMKALEFLPPDGDILVSLDDTEARLWRAPSWAEIEAAEKKTELKTH